MHRVCTLKGGRKFQSGHESVLVTSAIGVHSRFVPIANLRYGSAACAHVLWFEEALTCLRKRCFTPHSPACGTRCWGRQGWVGVLGLERLWGRLTEGFCKMQKPARWKHAVPGKAVALFAS